MPPPLSPPSTPPPHKPPMTSSNQDSPPSSFHWHYGSDFDDRNFEIHGRAIFFLIMLISITLLVTILFLYTRWICRHRPTAVSAASVAHAPPLKPSGLDAVSINSLPFVLFGQSGHCELAECAICLGIFVDGDKVKVLPSCRHCYHCECVDKWLTSHSSCPLCRDSLRVDSPV